MIAFSCLPYIRKKLQGSRASFDLRVRVSRIHFGNVVLISAGFRVAGIHGDLSQEQRTRSLEAFKKGNTPILVATDVAARGLDIPAVKLVVRIIFYSGFPRHGALLHAHSLFSLPFLR